MVADVPTNPVQPAARRPKLRWWLLGGAAAVVIAGAFYFEARTSLLESLLFSRWASEMSFHLVKGPSAQIRFPEAGPYDDRLGYSQLPSYIGGLTKRGFVVEKQAQFSPALELFAARHGYALYHEKQTAGLVLRDRSGAPLYEASYPERIYKNFATIPPLIVATLLFIENHTLLEKDQPYQNPAIEWQRFVFAAGGQIAALVDRHYQQGGGSTLATQIEKFEHESEGRTHGVFDKLLQMTAATTRAYLNGRDTTDARKQIVAAYLNATPLSSRPGYGEVIGIADGLRVWYGTDFAEANRVLAENSSEDLPLKAEIYKQILSLMVSERLPTYYLTTNRDALEALTNNHLHLLGQAGIISPELRDAALQYHLKFREEAPAPAPVSFVGHKASNAIRTELFEVLKSPNLYSLDRIDLSAQTTIDAPVQKAVSDVIQNLKTQSQVQPLGLVGFNLLSPGDNPSRVNYSVVVYERQPDRNVLRVHADSLDEPFDINTGAKLILGSTAKLRVMLAYLDIIQGLHDRYVKATPRELAAAESGAKDTLSQWVISYLAHGSDRSLKGILEAAMQRSYSGNTGEVFFTGGGEETFHNFEKAEDSEFFSVEDAFAHSVNLAFIRVLQDVRNYYIAQREAKQNETASAQNGSPREDYLKRFADQEGRVYLDRFYKDLRNKSPQDILAFMVKKTGPVPSHLAVVFRTLKPQASIDEFRQFLTHQMGHAPDEKKLLDLYENYGPNRFSLSDLGYISRINPLQLWLATYLQTHPGATRSEIMNAGADERQEAYGWLFSNKRQHQQNVRIRIVTEEDAFADLLPEFKKQGWPFDRLIPSLATAIGSSGDRPDALAELMGIIINNGVRLPRTNIENLQFAAGTPYETDLAFKPSAPQRIYAPEVIAQVRRALLGVVQRGTATRLRDTYYTPDGQPLSIGGKTGTSDNRLEHFGRGAQVIGSEAKDRTATFVFFLGDRFFGTVTAYVRGPASGSYKFTSALSVQLLKALQPQLAPLMQRTGKLTVQPAPLQASAEVNGKPGVPLHQDAD